MLILNKIFEFSKNRKKYLYLKIQISSSSGSTLKILYQRLKACFVKATRMSNLNSACKIKQQIRKTNFRVPFLLSFSFFLLFFFFLNAPSIISSQKVLSHEPFHLICWVALGVHIAATYFVKSIPTTASYLVYDIMGISNFIQLRISRKVIPKMLVSAIVTY